MFRRTEGYTLDKDNVLKYDIGSSLIDINEPDSISICCCEIEEDV